MLRRLAGVARDLGAEPGESSVDQLNRRTMLSGGALMSVGGLVWTALAGWYALWGAVIPFGYVLVTAANFAWFQASRNRELATRIQVLASLFLPFLFQWSIGGFVASGASMLWGMIALVGSLTVGEVRRRVGLLVVYCLLTIVSGVIDARVRALAAFDVPTAVTSGFFTVNIVAISSIVFGLTIYLNHRRTVAIAALEAEQAANRALVVSLAEARARAEDETRMRTLLFANMSHEIRTPMNAIVGLSHLALLAPLEEEQLDKVRKIHFAGATLRRVIDQLLDFSKLDSTVVELETEPFVLADIVGYAVSLVQQDAEQKGLGLATHVDPEIPERLVGDPVRLGQVLVNLLGNAVKFTAKGGVTLMVKLVASEDGRARVVVRVQDSGIGMSPEEIGRLFQPFTQADPTITRRFGGTGLGLAISQRLVTAMGDTIHAESTPDVGSTFSFTVSFGVAAVAPEAALPPWPLAGLSLLLAEDNEINADIGREILELYGARVDLAVNGAEAIRRVQGGGYDAVLMDMQMPVMDGLSAARALRDAGYTLPILALTANALSADRVAALEAGMNDHITKPLDARVLAETIRRWCPASTTDEA
jgi:signal transduction histidine kinase/CheY-like chemotaxis protein